MKPIKLNNRIMFSKCRANNYQVCVLCGEHIGEGNVGLLLRKICANGLNVWLHLNCMEEFCKAIVKFKEKNMKYILLESL